MAKCENCKKECKDDALFCPYCGTPIGAKTCRNCGAQLADEALFCHKCGAPVRGNVCAACGTENTDDALFCMRCGKPLTANAASRPQSAAAPASVTAAPKAASAPKNSISKEKAFTLARLIVLPCLLALIFLSGFFGMFKIEVPLYDGIEAEVSGFDAVRGMFLLIDPPAEKEVREDFTSYFEEYLADYNTDSMSEATQKRIIKKAIESYGAIKVSVYTENISTDLKAEVLLYGLHSLLLMLLSLIFFILSLCHTVKVLMRRDWKVWRGETATLSLCAATAFAFLITGGSLASASWGIFLLGLLGLSFILFTKVYVHKEPKTAPIVAVRRGVCAALVILTAFFISGAAVTVRSSTIRASVHPNDLYACMDDIEDTVAAGDYNLALDQIIKDQDATKAEKEEALTIVGHPALVFSVEDVAGLYDTPAKAVAWLLFAFRLAFAAALIALLFGELQADANPTKKSKWMFLRYGLLFAATCGVFGGTLPFAIMANAVAKDCDLKVQFSIGALQIAALIISAIALITYGVLKKAEKQQAQTVSEPLAPQPAAEYADAQQPTAQNE